MVTINKYKNKRVFISGSRSQTAIPPIVLKSLDKIMANNINVIIGDSEKGVDNSICDFFRMEKYPLVTVFTIDNNPRVTMSNDWDVHHINTNDNLSGQEKHMVSDREMVNEASWGLVIFDPIKKNRYNSLQVSAGSLRNTIQLLLNHKLVKFFYVYENNLCVTELKEFDDLLKLLNIYKNENLDKASSETIMSSRGINDKESAAKNKYNKIMIKFNKLLATEKKILQGNQGNDFKQIDLNIKY